MHRSDSGSKYRYVQTLLATTALVSAGAGHAQTNAEAEDSKSAVLEEIVVRGVAGRFRPDEQTSATGLNMTLIETPQSITVISSEMLREIGADSVYEAADLVPNVNRLGFGFGLQQIRMRGVQQLRRRVNGLEVDNEVTSIRSYAAEREEVVRGPATAIYGVTGGFGGEMNTILKVPENRFGGEFEANVGNYDSQQYKLDVTGPIPGTDGTVSGRLVGLYEEYESPVDIKNESFNNFQGMVLASVQWQPTDQTTLRLSYYHQERNVDPFDGGTLIQNDDGTLSIPDVNPDFWYFSHPDDSTERTEQKVILGELEHHFKNGMYAETKVMLDYFDHEIEYFFPFGPFGGFALADDEVYIYSYDIEEDGQRLTLSQSLGGEFELGGQVHQFLAAVEYNDDLDPNHFELLGSAFQGFAAIDWLSDDVFDGETIRFSDGTPFTPTEGDRDELFPVAKVENESAEDLKISLQMLLNPIDRLQILAGGMFQDNDTLDTVPVVGGVVLDPTRVTKTDFQEAIFRAGWTFDLLDNVSVIDDARLYYSFTQGFEPQVLIDAEGVGLSAPQDMKQHETGIKVELFDSAVGASLAGFKYEITNIAVFNSFLGGFGGFARQVLAGTQEAKGIEFELTGEVLPGWNVAANYGWLDAVLIDPNFDPIRPFGVPKHSGAITTRYEFLRGPAEGLSLGVTFKASGDTGFTTARLQERFGTQPIAGSHERFDINLSYDPQFGHLRGFEFFLNVFNVFDKDIIVSKQGNPAFGIMFIDRREVTGGVRYRFGS